jgi:uncharacterized protein (DUF1778 family)
MEHNEAESLNPEHVTVVSPDVYEKMVASLDEPTEFSRALVAAARRKRELIENK